MLDIGCGSGLFLGLAASTGRIGHGIGVDLNPGALASARRMAARITKGKLDFVEAATPASWPAGTFDVVSMIDVAHHVPSVLQETFFRSACRRVAPGGTLLYKDMAARPAWRALANRVHDLLLARQWIAYLPIETVLRIAAEEGLALTRSEDVSRLCYAHELRVFTRPA